MASDDALRRRVYDSLDERDLSWCEETLRSLLQPEFIRNDYFHRLARTILSPDLLTCANSFLTGFRAGFDVEAEAEARLRNEHIHGVDLLTQRHQGLSVARGAELIQVDIELARG